MDDIALVTVLLLVMAGLVAGLVDAVVGGGGLVQLPALMLAFPGAAPVQLVATNQLASCCGTSVSSVTLARRVKPDPRATMPLVVGALAGSASGALVASHLPREAFNPIILVVLLGVGAFTLFRPSLGIVDAPRWTGRRQAVAAASVGLTIGIYNGMVGPGAGTFLVFAVVGLLGYSFLPASAMAKIANLVFNLAALMIFVPQGAVMWGIGLAIGAANIAGAYLGARLAVARGATFIRVVFLVVITVFTVRIGHDVLIAWT